MEFFWARLDGLTDDEYVWEPGAGGRAARARAATNQPGPGQRRLGV
jgi:hypothetical protein